MSIRIMTRVWDSSPFEGTKLLIELALADFADDEGNCWPSMQKIATKARCSERYAREVVREMEGLKRLIIRDGGGRGLSNRYKLTPIKEEHSSPFPSPETRNSGAETRNSDAETRNPSSADPSRTVKESSSKASRKPPATIKALELTAEELAAFSAKYPALNVLDELEQFNDYQKAAGRGYADHMAAFRNWLRRAKPNVRPQTARNVPGRSAGTPAAVTDGKAWERYASGQD